MKLIKSHICMFVLLYYLHLYMNICLYVVFLDIKLLHHKTDITKSACVLDLFAWLRHKIGCYRPDSVPLLCDNLLINISQTPRRTVNVRRRETTQYERKETSQTVPKATEKKSQTHFSVCLSMYYSFFLNYQKSFSCKTALHILFFHILPSF